MAALPAFSRVASYFGFWRDPHNIHSHPASFNPRLLVNVCGVHTASQRPTPRKLLLDSCGAVPSLRNSKNQSSSKGPRAPSVNRTLMIIEVAAGDPESGTGTVGGHLLQKS